jgi:hypothetical protein
MATTYTVTLDTPSGEHVLTVVDAEYYKHEDGWVTFKDREHKVMSDIPEARIRLIARNQISTA